MANGTSSTPAATNSESTLKLNNLKDAGVKSLWVGLATGLALFAVQTAVVAGKAVLKDTKDVVDNLKS